MNALIDVYVHKYFPN